MSKLPTKPTTALLLIAHGSRQDEANADLNHAVAALRSSAGYAAVEAAFLELAEPNIDNGAARCVALGVSRVILLPYFLSPGIHVRRDLVAAQRRLGERHSGVEFRLAEPMGRHPLLLQVLSERASEAENLDSTPISDLG